MIPLYQDAAEIERMIQVSDDDSLASDDRALSRAAVEARVLGILQEVQSQGDAALGKIITRLSDPVLPESKRDKTCPWRLSKEALQEAAQNIEPETRDILEYAAANIRQFAEAAMASVQPVHLSHEGFEVGLNWTAIERVACYVPAGRFPLPSTALMTAMTAKVAGVCDICIVSPKLTDEVVAAGVIAGASSFYQLGGAHAVATMAYGTESIRPVSMVVGPGNAYVTEAKRQLQGVIGIDMLAGPSEVVIIADKDANPEWVAWDLLAQAEHSPDACAYLLSDSLPLAESVRLELAKALSQEALPEYLRASDSWGKIFVLQNLQQCVAICNQLAPEHVELLVATPEALKDHMKDYGALFMGYHTPVPFGDYAAGPNHTLPTNRSARFSGTLTPLTFLRPQSWIHATSAAQKLVRASEAFALTEGLIAHARSSALRLK
ncbi:MAG: histidinol dehydrogenase [Vampirovibrionales bacterium]|nr:histidinol dehydrogenase [Vampirovibrionales bacterium]